MRPRSSSLTITLVALLCLTACSQAVLPTPVRIATRAAPAVPAVVTPEQSTDVPTVTAVQPTAARTAAVSRPEKTVLASSPTLAAQSGYFSQKQLIEDAIQLADIIESTHPDPYIRGGGKVAFHYRLDRLLHAVPEQGMTKDGFIQLLRPFVAGVGDSHTEIWSDYDVSDVRPGGVPLRFGIVEQSLYVAGVLREQDQRLFGARLISVEGVPLAELLVRQRELVPLENIYHELENMASETLWYGPYLQDILPEWEDAGQLTLALQGIDGEMEKLTYILPLDARDIYTPQTVYDLPPAPSDGFYYTLLDPQKTGDEIAYLRVDHMQQFREDAEARGETGFQITSATETFRDMVVEMADAGAKTLIIDLRYNGGGSSLMADILIYFLYGKEALNSIKYAMLEYGGEVDRYSEQCFTPPNNIGETLEQVNERREIPIQLGGYDFHSFFAGTPEEFEQFLAQMGEPGFVDWFRAAPTFYSEYESEQYSGYYLPENVVALVSPWTFSSGFTMVRQLYRAGAILVGTPSAQASNSFGNGLLWRLDHTRVEGQVTRSYFAIFPEESGLGRVLPVNYPLTYEKLASYGFDPNAEFLYALELLPGD